MLEFIKKNIFNIFHKVSSDFDVLYKPNFNSTFPNLNHIKEINFDLINDLSINSKNYSEAKLITYIHRKDFYLKDKHYIYECWALSNNKVYTDNYVFQESTRRKIRKNLRRKSIKYNQKIFLFPYYSNQFGHFIGENLGSILFFLNFLKSRKKKEKLLIISPSKKWENFFQKRFKDNCFFMSDKILIKKNIIFSNCQIFPKISVFQNYIIARNFLLPKLENNKFKNKKIFLTSERKEKIINIDHLKKFLKQKKFIIINPKNFNVEKLLQILNSDKIVI